MSVISEDQTTLEARFTSDLNPPQAEAVLTTEGPLLLLAGAGSGKTRVLTRRIAYILATRRARRHEILAVTFTNKAAREMAERVAHLCGPGRFPDLGTFHSVCARWLRRHGHVIGLDSSFTIYAGAEQQVLMKEALRELNLDSQKYKPAAVLAQISSWKNRLVDPMQARMESTFNLQNHARTYAEYQKLLTQNKALDFDDILWKAVEMLRQDEPLRRQFQERLRYLCVDEYQDVNPVQYELIRLLATPQNNVCAVGDDDQSIYAFRGADISILLRFEKDFADARLIRLEQNYRSTEHILAAANKVVAHNRGRKRKNLWTDKKGGHKLEFFRASDGREEGRYIASSISSLHRDPSNPRPLTDFVVLYRTNAQSRLLEEAMIQAGLPYQIIGGLRFFERKEIKDMLSYFRVLQNPSDSVSLRRIINEPARGIGARSLEKLMELAAESQMPLFYALDRCREAGMTGKAVAACQEMSEWMQELAQIMAGPNPLTITELLEQVLRRSGYMAALRADNSVEAQARMENLEELLNTTQEFDRNRQSGPYTTAEQEGEDEEEDSPLESFLVEVSLLTDQDRAEGAAKEQVTLMTLHSAKGLEYPVVYLAGLEEETFPHSRSMDDPEQMEEERRLCYVGLTRAQERLFLTAAASRQMHGNSFVKKVSRFVDEIPPELFKDRPTTWGGTVRGERFEEAPAIGSSSWKGFGQTAPRVGARPAVPSLFAVGDTVEHKVFGRGKVVATDRTGDLITVDFVNGSTRKLKSSFLKKVAGDANPAPTPPAVGSFGVGDRVRHQRWGHGTIKSVAGDTLTVVFPGMTVNLNRADPGLSR
jgi:DNA helicase-2/ATP-dependent DNA helicase PcrA